MSPALTCAARSTRCAIRSSSVRQSGRRTARSHLGGTPFFDAFRHVVETGETWAADAIEFTVPAAGGGKRQGVINIQVARSGDGFFATFQDLSERERERRERDHLAQALEQTVDGVVTLDPDGIVTYANPAFLEMVGRSHDEVVGSAAEAIAMSSFGPDAVASLQEAAIAGLPSRIATTHPGPDGTARHLEVTVTPVRARDGTPTGFVIGIRDVTVQHEAERRLDRRRALDRAVAEVDRSLLRLDDPGSVALAACRAMVDTGEVAIAWMGLLDPESGRVVSIVSHGDTGFLDAAGITSSVPDLDRGAAGEAIRASAPVVVGEIGASLLSATCREAADRFGLRSLAAVPLRHGDTTQGVFVVFGARPDAFGPDEVAVLEKLAADVATALTAIEQSDQRRALEVALVGSEQRFREALADVTIAAVMLDTSFRIQFANRHFLELVGWEEADVIGHDWHDRFTPPRRRATERAADAAALRLGSVPPYRRGPVLTRAGDTREIGWSSALLRDATGAIVGIASLGNDVTERVQARAALAASEARLRTAFESMLEGVSILSAIRDANGQIVDFRLDYSNPAIGVISGVPAAYQTGHTLLELFPAHRENGLFDAYVRVVETGVPFDSGVVRYVDPDAAGGPHDQTLEHRAARMGDGYVLSVLDITQRKAAEDEILRLNEELEARVLERTASLEAANKELGTFSYSVSHDLKSPLRAITGFAEILQRRYGGQLDAKGRHYLDNIVEGGRHMGVLIDELLEYSRPDPAPVGAVPVPLGPILERLRTTFADRIRAGGGMLAVAEPLAVPVADPTLIEQVLTNLLDNALIYRRDGVAPLVTVSAVRHGDRVTVAVADNGIGIASEHQEQIFEPFVRLHAPEAYPGTGIGLATVRKAARRMGSEVTVISVPGEGSIFALELSAAAPPAARVAV